MIVCRAKKAIAEMLEYDRDHSHLVPLFLRTASLEGILRNDYSEEEFTKSIPLRNVKERELVEEIETALDNPDQPYPNECPNENPK